MLKEDFRQQLDREGVAGKSTSGHVGFDEKILPLYNKPQEIDFVGQTRDGQIITEEDVAKDNESLNRFENSPQFKKEKGPKAVLAEYALLHGINNGWFGAKTKAELTSRFDDYVRGVDILVTIDNGRYPIQFGIDATASNDEEILTKKYGRELTHIKDRKFTKLKYSERTTPVQNIIVAFQPLILDRLAETMTGNPKYPGLEKAAQLSTIELMTKEILNNINFLLNKNGLPHGPLESAADLKNYCDSQDFNLAKKTLPGNMLAALNVYIDLIAYFGPILQQGLSELRETKMGAQILTLAKDKKIFSILTGELPLEV